MRIVTIIATAVLAINISAAMAWSKIEIVEGARSEMLPYNSDSLFVENNPLSSLYIKALDEWSKSSTCDTLYTAEFSYPFEWLNREVLLRLGYVDAPYSVEVNGVEVAQSRGGELPMEFNITRSVQDDINVVGVRLSPNSDMRQLEGWRASNEVNRERFIEGARVVSPAKMTIRDVIPEVSSSDGVRNARIGVVIKSYNIGERESTLRYVLRGPNGSIVRRGSEDIKLRLRGEDTLYVTSIIPNNTLWSTEVQNMHTLEMQIVYEGHIREHHTMRIGLRELSVDDSGEVEVNGEAVSLRAKRVDGDISWNEIDDLKYAGYNTLLVGAGECSEELLDMCDELGLYVIITAPIDSHRSGDSITIGGNVTNDPDWLESYLERAEGGYRVAQLHASFIGYIFAERSLNGNNLYECYLRLKEFGGSRPMLYLDAAGEWNSDKLKFEE